MLSNIDHVGDDQKTGNTRSIIQFMGGTESLVSKPDLTGDKGSIESFDGAPNQELVDFGAKDDNRHKRTVSNAEAIN